MHAEDTALRPRCSQLYTDLAGGVRDYGVPGNSRDSEEVSIANREIIDHFGRFPHRNKDCSGGRTRQRIAFLQEPELVVF
jgi:uncharacterized protein (DUF924 family)